MFGKIYNNLSDIYDIKIQNNGYIVDSFNIEVLENTSLHNNYCFNQLFHTDNLIFSIFPKSNPKNILRFKIDEFLLYGSLYDINNDSIINIIDVIDLVNCILYYDCHEYYDITDDGFINIIDIMEIVNFILEN